MLRDYSRTIAGKEQLLIGAIAKALEIIPRQLCDNAGFDATNILNKLRQKHAQGRSTTFDCLLHRKYTSIKSCQRIEFTRLATLWLPQIIFEFSILQARGIVASSDRFRHLSRRRRDKAVCETNFLLNNR